MTPTIAVGNLRVRYGRTDVLQNVGWRVADGDFWAVAGPNGAGKTTLLKTILGLLPADDGQVDLFGTPLGAFHDWRKIGYLPQFSGLTSAAFPATVREVVTLGRLPGKRWPRWMKAEDHHAVNTILEQLGIADLARRRFGKLSGGQHQRVMLARALVNRPRLLLLDEPVLALDPEARTDFYHMLDQLNQTQAVTIVLVTHDSATAGRHARDLLYVDRQVIFAGKFQDFCRSAAMTRRFGPAAQHSICGMHHVETETQ